MALLDDVRKSIRISNTANDDEISDVIEACKIDMANAGIIKIADTDALIKQAIKLYAKDYFNFQGEGERWHRAYSALKDSMALCGDYNKAVSS